MHSADVGGDMFGFGAGVFSAIEGTDGINPANGFSLSIEPQQGHKLGNLQQAPHRRHLPRRAFETGKTEVIVRLILAPQVFLDDCFTSFTAIIRV